jgi:hypothetical protein
MLESRVLSRVGGDRPMDIQHQHVEEDALAIGREVVRLGAFEGLADARERDLLLTDAEDFRAVVGERHLRTNRDL